MTSSLPPLTQLRLFAAAARHLSFKEAARELHLTPSAVSHGVRTLEDWLGVKLFARGHNSLSLTVAGAEYLPAIEKALNVIASATEAVPGRKGPRRISVSVAPTFGVRWLVPHLHMFAAANNGVEVALDTAQQSVPLNAREPHLAIRMGSGDWPGLEKLKILTERLVPVCAPAMADRIKAPADLCDRTLIHVTTVTEDWRAWASLAGNPDLPAGAGLRVDRVELAINAAAEGLGVAIGREPLIDNDVRAGRIVPVLGPARPCRTGYWLLATPEALERADVRAFWAWIAGLAGP